MTLASVAWACVGLIAFRVEGSSVVEPGGTLQIFGGEFAAGQEVQIHLDGADGPVLATVEDPQPSTMTSRFTIDVPIPEDISPGPHVLVATQEHFDMNAGIPARAAFQVGTSEPLPVEADGRPAAVAATSGQNVLSLVLIALVTAGAGLLIGAAWNLGRTRRSSTQGGGVTAA